MIFGPMDEAASACNAAARERLGGDLVVLHVASSNQGHETAVDREIDDPGGKVARAYRARPGAVILVRPDGHIAWRSPKADRRGLEAWLDRVLLQRRPADEGAIGP